MSIKSVIGSLGNNHQSDMETAALVGRRMGQADNAYNEAVKSGDAAKIAEAETARQKAVEQFASYMAIKNKKHDLIMQIIQMIAR